MPYYPKPSSGSSTATGDKIVSGNFTASANTNSHLVSFISGSTENAFVDFSGNASFNTVYIGRGLGNVASNTAIGTGALKAATNSQNTAVGAEALAVNAAVGTQLAIGYQALSGAGLGGSGANLGVGNNTLQWCASGSNNVAVGHISQQGVSGSSPSYNTSLGNSTLRSNTDGAGNVAIGYYSQGNVTSGSYNTAVGYASFQSGLSPQNNIAIGYSAMGANSPAASPMHNVAIGAAVLNAASGSGAFASVCQQNVGVGNYTLQTLTTGAANTAIGYSSMPALTDGVYNTAVGMGSLQGVATSQPNTVGNVAIGYNAMGAVASATIGTGPQYNIAIGNSAGLDMAGSQNVAIGFTAGFKLTSGSSNIAVGQGTLYNMTGGSSNVAIGTLAMNGVLNSSSNPTSNVALGANTLFVLRTGSNNVALGQSAGGNVSYGNGNVLAGYLAGGSITTGSNNVFVGYAAGLSVYSGSNSIIIGNIGGNDNMESQIMIGPQSEKIGFSGTMFRVNGVQVIDSAGNWVGNSGSVAFNSNETMLMGWNPNFANAYAINYNGDGTANYETWTDSSTSRLRKRVDYTWSTQLVATCRTRVYSAADGTTVVGDMTETYTYSSGKLASSTTTRSV